MSRPIFDQNNILASTLSSMSHNSGGIIDEVSNAIASNKVVVVGMKGNPHCNRAVKSLKKEGINYCYLEYGSYLAQWKKRLSLKMWVGWKTFPMVFSNGKFIGGADELRTYLKSADAESIKKAS